MINTNIAKNSQDIPNTNDSIAFSIRLINDQNKSIALLADSINIEISYYIFYVYFIILLCILLHNLYFDLACILLTFLQLRYIILL